MNANMTRYDSLRYTWLAGMGQMPFNWNPPNGYPHSFDYWGTLVLPRWNFAFSLGVPGSVGGATIDTTAPCSPARTPRRGSPTGWTCCLRRRDAARPTRRRSSPT